MDIPVVLPRPENMGPIPVPALGPGNDEKMITIKESQLKKEVWLAFNRGYNDGFVRGFHNAMQRRGVRQTESGQRFKFNKNVKNK